MFLRVSWPFEEVALAKEVRLESKTHITSTVVDGIRVRRSQQQRTRLLTMITSFDERVDRFQYYIFGLFLSRSCQVSGLMHTKTSCCFIKKLRSWSMQRARMVLLCSTEVLPEDGIGTSRESARKEWWCVCKRSSWNAQLPTTFQGESAEEEEEVCSPSK